MCYAMMGVAAMISIIDKSKRSVADIHLRCIENVRNFDFKEYLTDIHDSIN